MQLSIVQGPSRGIAFKAGPHNLEDGNLAISAAEDGLQVDADATFKVSLRPGVEEEFFDDDSKWEFSGICDGEFGPDLLGTVQDGLEEEVYEFKNRMGSGTASRYLIDVATAESKNVL